MKKIIRVTGKGQISVPPDRIRLLFELEERKDTYREAIKASKESVDELRKLLEKAVKDSRVKAEVLAKAAGMNLDELMSIDYSWGELKLTTSPYGRLMDSLKCNDSEDDYYMSDEPLQLEPEDIRVSDTVTVSGSCEIIRRNAYENSIL